MHSNSTHHSSGERSTSTSISISSGLGSSIDGNNPGPQRRNSWHKQRGSSIAQILQNTPQRHASEAFHMQDLSPTSPVMTSPLDDHQQPVAGPSRSPRPIHRSYASQHSLESVQSAQSATPTEADDQLHLAPSEMQNTLRWKNDAENGELRHSESRRYSRRLDRPAGHYGETSTPRRTMGTLKSVSRNIRRVSVRVLTGITLEDRPIRLDDDVTETGEGSPELHDHIEPEAPKNHLRGRTLGILGPNSGIRRVMLRVLLWKWTEPIILLLILANGVILALQAHLNVQGDPRPVGRGFFKSWEDYALFMLFVIFTLEAFARVVVTGFILDPETRITDSRALFNRTSSSIQSHFQMNPPSASLDPVTPMKRELSTTSSHAYPPSSVHSRDASSLNLGSTWIGTHLGVRRHPFQLAIAQQQILSERNLPYLRHSWNRIDFIAVVSFWIMFILAMVGVENTAARHIYIFRALSVLRVARLLAVTNGTTTIMRSLKIAGPLLVHVALFVLFAILLFTIVGVQAFKGSMRRNCQLGNFTLPNFCGGQIDSVTLLATGYYDEAGVPTTAAPKGYICPLGLICQEQSSNPESGLQSFDNVFYGALQVIIIAGANGWAPTMYDMMDSDFYSASIFFIVCIVILNFWLVNMFVAVITNTFGAIRAETQKSAFGAGKSGPVIDEKDEGWSLIMGNRDGKSSRVQEIYLQTRIGWVFLIFVDLVIQGTRTSDSSDSHLQFLEVFETTATIAFDFEMIWRVWGYLPDWRKFGDRGTNNLDLLLAVITTIIQIPQIKRSSAYPWLTIFQLLRFYRVILAVPTMRPLLLRVFGNLNGLFNMTLFLLITNVLGALVAVQLFRGDIEGDNNPNLSPMNFAETYSAFLAMYQIFSSENWTNVLYLVADAETQFGQALIAILFFVAWFVFANFIMLQMFIAVINENFEVAEEQKRAKQFDAYLRKAEPASARVNWLDRWNPYRFVKAQPSSLQVENMPSALVLPLRSNVVQDKRGKRQGSTSQRSLGSIDPGTNENSVGVANTLRRLFSDDDANGILMSNLKSNRRDSNLNQGAPNDELENLDYMPNALPDIGADETHDTLHEQNAQRVDFIDAHPTYDKTFWLLSNENPLRYICQLLVTPANGTRIFGAPPSPLAEPFFKLIIILAVLGGIIVAAWSSPTYRRGYYQQHGLVHDSWFDIAETVFGGVLILEFIIKVIADGFIFTPNAYLLSIWNIIDFGILIALLINMVTTIVIVGGLSRGTRSLRAFRALRLITFFPWMRDTFYSVLFAGAQSLFEAALLALLYMVPYAIWGVNLFTGLMFTCNDSSVSGKGTCINEYVNAPIPNSTMTFLAPRAWDKPSPSTTFSFDNFGSSLLILFEVVSFEGWIDVMTFAMNLVGLDVQPSFLASQHNSIFFVTYDLLGAVIILTLFVSIIIGNFSSRSGMALLTEDQKRWIDLKKLIKRQGPSKRPKIRPTGLLRAWCYDRAVHKNGWWSRCMTGLYILHILALATQTFTNSSVFSDVRDYVFLVLTTIYLFDTIVRMTGLGLRSFTANGWNHFDVLIVFGSFATTVPIVLGSKGFLINQLQKLFLVCIAFKLVQKNNSLNQLFKTAVSSLPAILKLLLLWFTLFIFFAIVYVEVFGLTRWESAETRYQNYREFSNALIMLAFMCFGEGWNQYMHDFTVSYPRCTNSSPSDGDSDCGSQGWAYTLFIAWNLLSMYIFVNMFTGLVVENFSYVFQLNNSQSSINRHEMRGFKKNWATFDVNGTGYLKSGDLVPFLARLSGVFEVRIYPSQFSIQNIIQDCKHSPDGPRTRYSSRVEGGIDMSRLAAKLGQLDQREVAKRRLRYNRLYQEARRLAVENGKGISFTNMLLLLAHYKMINDETALQVDEMISRRDTTAIVDELVDRDRVLSLLKMIACRRRYAREREAEAAAFRAEQQGDIPAIVVEDDGPKTPQHRSWDITQANRDSQGFRIGDESPSPSPIRPVYSPESPYYQPSEPTSPVQVARAHARYSDASVLSGEWGTHLGAGHDSFASRAASPQQVLSTLDSSVWGGMMGEGAEDE